MTAQGELTTRRRLTKIRHAVTGFLGRQETPVSVLPEDFRYAFYRGQDGQGRHLLTFYAKAKGADGTPHDLQGQVLRLPMECCNVFSETAPCKAAAATGSGTPPSDPPPAQGEPLMKIDPKQARLVKDVPAWVHKIKDGITGLPEQVTEALDELHDWAEEALKTPELQKALELPVEEPQEKGLTEGRAVEKRDDGSMEIYLPFAKVDEEQRVVHGVVYEPDVVDAQGDWASAEDIRKACHDYMLNSRRTGLMHKDDISSKAPLVENYIAPTDMIMGNQRVRKGTWIMAHKINDDVLWKDIKDGKLTGLSMSGKAVAAAE